LITRKRLRNIRELGHQPARAQGAADAQLDLAGARAARGALLAQVLQARDAALVARAPRLDALADPGFLLRPEAVELAVGDGLGRQLFRFFLFIKRKIPGKGKKLPPVEFHDARGDAVEEGAVVGDDDG
jgi:hypothetical protein